MVADTTRTSTLIGCLAADALELLLLQRAQQLDLHRGRDVADLVEEQRAAVGELEPAELLLDRAGERALLVAEQLALEQRLGQRAAVDLDERAVRALAEPVDRARDQLLAGAALAGDEHGGVARRDLLDRAPHDRHLLAAADQLGEPAVGLGAQVVGHRLGLAAAAARRAQLERALDLEAHDLGLDRLGEEVERAELHRLDRGLDGAEPGDDHDRHVGIERA